MVISHSYSVYSSSSKLLKRCFNVHYIDSLMFIPTMELGNGRIDVLVKRR